MAGGIIYEGNVSNSSTSEALMAERINENFNQAIDIIVQKRLEDLAFDKTETCLIENLEKIIEPDGTESIKNYIVNNGSISYKAKARPGEVYSKGQKVYVTIPNNDYENVKTIAGLCVDTDVDTNNYYISIFDSFIDVTGNILNNNNLININDDLINNNPPFTLLANCKDLPKEDDGSSEEKISNEIGESSRYFVGATGQEGILKFKKPLIGYDVFAVSFDLKTNIVSVKSGVYSVNISLFYLKEDEEDSAEWHEQVYSWSTVNTEAGQYYSNFTGDPYNYGTYTTQQFKIFLSEIPKNSKIMGMKGWIYQGGNFIWNSSEGEINYFYNENLPNTFYNIAIKNFKIDFGWNPSSSDFSSTDKAILSSPDSSYYTRTDTEDSFNRTITLNWVHIFQDEKETIPMVINEKEDFTKYSIVNRLNKVRITWYEWAEVASEEEDAVTNRFWKQIGRSYWTIGGEILGSDEEKWYAENAEGQNEKFPFEISVNIQPNTTSVTYKAFIEYGLNLYKNLDNLDDVPKNDYVAIESNEFTFYATVPAAEGLQAKDLIEGLSFSTENDDNRKGQYFLYEQETNLLFNSVEKSKIRKLKVKYNPAATGNIPETEMLDGGCLYWKVPVKDTMLSFISPEKRIAKNVSGEGEQIDLYHKIDKTKDIELIQEKFSVFDDFYDYYYVKFNNNLYKSEDLDYLNFRIKNQYVSTSNTNDVTCVLYDENDNMVCGGKFQFIFNYESAAKKVINASWGETQLWVIGGNKTYNENNEIVDRSDEGGRGQVLKTFTLFENPEALPVGGYLSQFYNIRYATRVDIQVFNYNSNPLFISQETGISNLTQYISNPVISLGEIYNRRTNFSIFGQDIMDVMTIQGETKENITLNGGYEIEGQDSGETKTLTNLVFYDNQLYYVSPFGTRASLIQSNDKLYPGLLEDAWPEVITFKSNENDGVAPSVLPVHFFRKNISNVDKWIAVEEGHVAEDFKTIDYNLVSGADLIVYDENGSISAAGSEGYNLSDEQLPITWEIASLVKQGINTYTRESDTTKYFKFVSDINNDIENILQPTRSAIPVNKTLFIEAKNNNEVVYKMPLRIIKKVYGLSLLSDWDGQNTPSIFGNVIDNKFSGVFTGYNSILRDDNDQQISDGDSLEIFKEEKITSAEQFKPTEIQYYVYNGDIYEPVAQSEEVEFNKNQTYYIKEDRTINDTSSYGLFGYKDGQAIFALQQENPYFTIRSANGIPLIQIAETGEINQDGTAEMKYFLQSDNYRAPDMSGDVVDLGEGMYIDLTSGEINSMNVSSILYAKEIKAKTSIALLDENNNTTVAIGEGTIITQANETTELLAGEKIYQMDEDGNVKVDDDGNSILDHIKGLSIQRTTHSTDDGETAVTDVILREAILQECVMEGTFVADSAVIKGMTIADGTIIWTDENNNQTTLIKENSLSGLNEIIFSNGSKLFLDEKVVEGQIPEFLLKLNSDLNIKTGQDEDEEDVYTSLVDFITDTNDFVTRINRTVTQVETSITSLNNLTKNLVKTKLKLPIKWVDGVGSESGYYVFDSTITPMKEITVWLEKEQGEEGANNSGE